MHAIMPPRLLIAEDHEVIRMRLADWAEDAGFRAVAAYGRCGQVWDHLARETPDVAVLDIKLADGFVFELARELRRRGCHVVFYSSNEPALCEGTEFAQVPFYQKPHPMHDALADCYRRHFQRPRTGLSAA